MSPIDRSTTDTTTALAATQVRDLLDRCDRRNQNRKTQKRRARRSRYHAAIYVCSPDSIDGVAQDPGGRAAQAWSRCLSQNGLSFLFRGRVPRKDNRVVIGLPEGASHFWIEAKIVWSRLVPDGFWEYGVEFQGRVQL